MEIPKICRYCGGVVRLVPAAEVYGMAAAKRLGIEQERFYQCQNCNARVGCHIPMYLYLPTGLSEQDKELVLLRIDKKLSFDEIAEYYGITNDACRQRLSRAIRKCRSLLDCEK